MFSFAIKSFKSSIQTSTMSTSIKMKHVDTKKLMANIDTFIFDLDGVIWRGDVLIDGVEETLNKLRILGKRIFFVTNNSTKSRIGLVEKFTKLGLNINYDEIFSSSFAASAYLKLNPLPIGKKVYVIGHEGIEEELDLLNIPHIGGPSDAGKICDIKKLDYFEYDKNVGAVIVGLDLNFNYYKMNYAQNCINNNKDCLFIATNLDAVAHLTEQQEWVGGGGCVGAIKGCTGKSPILVGKPSSLMIDYIVDTFNINNKETICMVGDRLDTDILFGLNNQLTTILTLSGVTSEKKLLDKENEIIPKYYIDSIKDFFQ